MILLPERFNNGKEKTKEIRMEPELKNSAPSEKKYSKAGIGLAIGLSIGTGIGLLFGYAIDIVYLGLVIGMGGGMLIGLSIGAAAANRRK